MNKSNKEIYNLLHSIYDKHRKQYKRNPDTKQMCCMWSLSIPPDVIEETPPFNDIEDVFEISITDEECSELYDMNLDDACTKISQKINILR